MLTPDLSRRLARAVNRHEITFDERARIVDATLTGDVRIWADLPRAVRDLVEEIEKRPSPLAGLAAS